MPTTIVAIANVMICDVGSANSMKSTRAIKQGAEDDPQDDPEHAADQRGDDALVPDHAPHLAPCHPDRPQHPELARPLEDVSTSVFTIPKRLTMTDSASST